MGYVLVNRNLGLFTLITFLSFTPSVLGQIIPDRTLPNNTIVTPNNNINFISAGTRIGSNLFHSFQNFSLSTGNIAFFNNPNDIQNIISRVTGNNISNIDGLIKANSNANLFLINPQGIIFGKNAQLALGGSFIASTANSIKFADGSEFSAVNPNAPSLLTINLPVGLQFGTNPSTITNQSQSNSLLPIPPLDANIPISQNVGLEVIPGQTLALIGGDINLNNGNLTALSGNIHLGSIASPGLVNLQTTPLGLNFNYNNIPNFGNITANNATINTSGIGGGKINIKAGNINLNNSKIYALTLGNIDGRGIDINAQNFRAAGGTQISSLTLGTGQGGDINISTTDTVELNGIGLDIYQKLAGNFVLEGTVNPFASEILLLSGTSGNGTAGEININTNHLLMENGSITGTATFATGNGGNINIRAKIFDITGSAINSGTIKGSVGLGGNVNFEGEKLIVRDGAAIISLTRNNASSGNINIQASESVEILRTPNGSPIQTTLSTTAAGDGGKAGDINVNTKKLVISDGTVLSSGSGAIIGQKLINTTGGPGGNLKIKATESIQIGGISGVLANGGRNAANINAETNSPSRGGDIYISTPVLTLYDGGYISSSSIGIGDAGNISIDAQRIEILGNKNSRQFLTQIQASVGFVAGVLNPNATANAGSLHLNTNQLIIRNGGSLNVQTLGTGQAGNINVNGNTIFLENQSSIDATTLSGLGGNINLQTQNLQMRTNSRIKTDAGAADGGNIMIKTNTLASLENSDITANAQKGFGGRVSISSQGIFGTEYRLQLTTESDITATSDLGAKFSGMVQINTPNINPAAGLANLSQNFADIGNQINATCSRVKGNQFIITGRGGLPLEPNQLLLSNSVLPDLGTVQNNNNIHEGNINHNINNNLPAQVLTSKTASIVEANTWKVNQNGGIELVENLPENTLQNFWPQICGQ